MVRELLKVPLECFLTLEPAGSATKRPDLIGLLWNAATLVAPNMRMFESLQRLKADAKRLSGMKLTEPLWWKAKKAHYLASTKKSEA